MAEVLGVDLRPGCRLVVEDRLREHLPLTAMTQRSFVEEDLGKAVRAEEGSFLQWLFALATWRVGTLTVPSIADHLFR